MGLDLTTPLPGDWNDAAFDEAHRRLKANPKSLTDSDITLFRRAHNGQFAEVA